MKKLDEYNVEMYQLLKELVEKKKLAGVLCPKCETEMVYTNAGRVLLTFPPKK